MERTYILTRLGAFGLCSERNAPRNDEKMIEEALASCRLFNAGKFQVQPILITRTEGVKSFSTEHLEGSMAISCSDLFYQLSNPP